MLAQGTSRLQIAAMVLNSPEGEAFLTNSFYNRFLHRAADPAGLQSAVALFQQGQDDRLIIAGLVGSDEYFNLS
jgi:hypothetical protein